MTCRHLASIYGMERQRLRWLGALVIALTVLYTMSVYPSLPERLATHWGVNGQPNSWSPRAMGAWLIPGMMVFIWGLSVVLPSFDPEKFERIGAGFPLVITAVVVLEGVVQWAVLNVALGHPVAINTVVYVGVGVLFVVILFALRPASRVR